MKQMNRGPADVLARADAAVPDGLRVYAVGDIHGRADLLDRMADLIERDGRERPARNALTVLLGDYIDRGPSSAQVVERLVRADFPTVAFTLKGNHEDILHDFLGGGMGLGRFYHSGGDATLRSYGLDPDALTRMWPRAALETVQAAVPAAHRRFLDGLRPSMWLGDYFFCHAGARPGVPLGSQRDQDLMWIREDFLESAFDFGKVVVHGHTPVPHPWVRANGIAVDTKAYASGVLTALVLEGTERRFLQTEG